MIDCRSRVDPGGVTASLMPRVGVGITLLWEVENGRPCLSFPAQGERTIAKKGGLLCTADEVPDFSTWDCLTVTCACEYTQD